jgi:hypothetical protein
MSQDLKEFENSLKGIRPRPLSRELEGRLIDQLKSGATTPARFSAPLVGLLMMAAVLLISVAVWLYRAPPSVSPTDAHSVAYATAVSGDREQSVNEFQPVQAKNTLLGRIDEGIVFLNNGISARRYRYQFIDTVTWEDPSDGARISMEVPREEIVLVPVQTF